MSKRLRHGTPFWLISRSLIFDGDPTCVQNVLSRVLDFRIFNRNFQMFRFSLTDVRISWFASPETVGGRQIWFWRCWVRRGEGPVEYRRLRVRGGVFDHAARRHFSQLKIVLSCFSIFWINHLKWNSRYIENSQKNSHHIYFYVSTVWMKQSLKLCLWWIWIDFVQA